MSLLHTFLFCEEINCCVHLAHQSLLQSLLKSRCFTLCCHANTHLLRETCQRLYQLLIRPQRHPLIVLEDQLPVCVVLSQVRDFIPGLHHSRPKNVVHEIDVGAFAVEEAEILIDFNFRIYLEDLLAQVKYVFIHLLVYLHGWHHSEIIDF